jgi:hypothetical protein
MPCFLILEKPVPNSILPASRRGRRGTCSPPAHDSHHCGLNRRANEIG